MSDYLKPEFISMKDHPDFSEKWLQARIREDVTILGLGELDLISEERIQPSGGRLDLLLRDPETRRRFEIELQLGETDESHIIRTIEYWDVERRRYPDYDHCAVIVAEKINTRFLNVISLFNGAIPLIAIQVQAVRVGSAVTLVFTRVLDEVRRGLPDDEEAAESAPADRNYWLQKGSKRTVESVDMFETLAREIDPKLRLNFNKHYIGFSVDGVAFNFATFRPKKAATIVEFKIAASEQVGEAIEDSGLDQLSYDTRYGSYRIRLKPSEFSEHRELLKDLLMRAHTQRTGT
jgi:hypothetical protein